MIRIKLIRDSNNNPRHLLMDGHADQGPYGSDIVCAAASALAETLILGLEQVVRETVDGQLDEGRLDIRFHSIMSPESRAVVETILAGLKDLAMSEPRYVNWNENQSDMG